MATHLSRDLAVEGGTGKNRTVLSEGRWLLDVEAIIGAGEVAGEGFSCVNIKAWQLSKPH